MRDENTKTDFSTSQIRFLSMEENDVEAVKDNMMRTLSVQAS